MNFYTYIGKSPESFEREYIDTGLVQRQSHREYPLDIYAYGRKAVHEQVWDEVTCKCRGIIVNRETGEIVARPFEKFFNLRTAGMPETEPMARESDWGQPTVWEKVDGFLCTLYEYNGERMISSKGSFNSPHAKWATGIYLRNHRNTEWPKGYTPVFEGICPMLRIVVDYDKREELVLLALVNNETGEELNPNDLMHWGIKNGIRTPHLYTMTWQDAHSSTLKVRPNEYVEEGFVLTWYRAGRTPYRLKLKFTEYLRMHRMVTGISPKYILETLQNGWKSEMNDLLTKGTPWFSEFVAKWKWAIEAEYKRLFYTAHAIYQLSLKSVDRNEYRNMGDIRKDFALYFNRPENKPFAAICFALLDGKREADVIWKMVKHSPIMKGGHRW